MKKFGTAAAALLLLVSFGTVAEAQSARERENAVIQEQMDAAAAALTAAERVGAPVYAKSLYEEASARLRWARDNAGSDRSEVRNSARLRAIEARYAARAAETNALLNVAATEATNLRADIVRFRGTAPDVELLITPPAPVLMGTDSRDRVDIAQRAIDRARAAGVDGAAATELKEAETWVESARKISANDADNESANHLAFKGEMVARRLEAVARMAAGERVMPSLRMERTRLATAAREAEAAEERARREQVEREAEELRARLSQLENDRRAEAAEVERMRRDVAERELALQTQLSEDRAARIEAEQRLDDLMRQYESALARATTTSEVDELRRRVEDQRLELQILNESERRNADTLREEITRLETELARARATGRETDVWIEERERELTRSREDLARIERERTEAEQRRLAAEQAHQQAITAAETRIREAEARTAALQAQIEQERREREQLEVRAQQERATAEQERTALAQERAALEQELATARGELARREAVERERARLESELRAIANTRTDTRGIVVTLPGIFFDSGRSVLKAGAKNSLNKIAEQLKDEPNISIAIEGHTDSVGSDASNQALSEKRAAAVREALVLAGVSTDRITVTGRGEAAPVASNDTAAGRQQNRRVELVITH